MKTKIVFKDNARDITYLGRLAHEQLESLEIGIEKGLFKNKPCEIVDWKDVNLESANIANRMKIREYAERIEKTYDLECTQKAKGFVEWDDDSGWPWVFLGHLQDVLRFLKQEKLIEYVSDVKELDKELDISIKVNFGDLTPDELSLIGELPRTPSMGDIMGLSTVDDIIDAIEKG